jgi:GDP-mannose pyrophosphatase NudK
MSNAHPQPPSRLRNLQEQTLSSDWFVLKKTCFDFQRRDGSWQRQCRETYDRGNGAVLLPYNRAKGTVLLTRQFRFPAYVNGCPDGMLIEACAGLLDGDDPARAIQRETEEELGLRIRAPKKVFDAYMSPGSVTEKLHFFVAEYEAADRVSAGGGKAAEGEDIEVIELPLQQAMEWVAGGHIQDGKTIMLLQWLLLSKTCLP